MCNFRKSESDLDCTKCLNFKSYQDVYEDEMEPHEFGICSEVDDMVGEEMICDEFKNRKNLKVNIMNNLLINKEAIRLRYKKDFGTDVPYNNNGFDIKSSSKRDYINWLESIVSKVIEKEDATWQHINQ